MYYSKSFRGLQWRLIFMTMKIYLTNLGKYNEGELVGEWVSLPIDEEELNAVFDRIMICHDDKMYYDEVGCPYEEYFITDYECDFYQIGEYEDLDSLNEMAEELESLDDDQEEIVKILMSEYGYSLEDAAEKVNNGDYIIYSDCDDMTDVAYQVVEECGYLSNVPETVARYFDYEAFGRDLGLEGNFSFMNNGDCVEIL